ncbi:acyl-CoA thioesterase-2 [Salana multivorans]|uniref:Acyl-CoA thioesterase-2 n=1 Tax=Salana multivorans TaxID=120377 RepID=A0A3N2DD58_9MICO|nr:acyl-CoA thioesterase domain-containing protein [Salana multivorans]ROR97719.1 acyl-CoA thioesterase-2 [Salana multivorans]
MTDPSTTDPSATPAIPPSCPPSTGIPSGAEAFAEICRVLDVERTGPDEFVGQAHPHSNGRIYGGQVFAQSIIAAARTVPADRHAHSVHGYFLRPGKPDLPIAFAVEELHDGRSFSARRTHALQEGVPILSLIASFQEDQEGFEHRQDAPPDVPRPDRLASSDLIFRNPRMPDLTTTFLMPISALDIRHVRREIFTAPDPEPSYTQAVWIRAHGELPAWADRNARAALLAYVCDHVMLEPVLRGHGLSWTTRGLSVASIDHAMWWHRDVDVTRWLLFVQYSPAAQGGRGLGAVRVYDEAGELVASVAQEGVVRLRD